MNVLCHARLCGIFPITLNIIDGNARMIAKYTLNENVSLQMLEQSMNFDSNT